MQTPPPEHSPDTPELFNEPPRETPRVAETPSKGSKDSTWIYTLLLSLILLAGAFLRFRGIDWDEFQYVHPDERFLGFVENEIQPVNSPGKYFDTQIPILNSQNRGDKFVPLCCSVKLPHKVNTWKTQKNRPSMINQKACLLKQP